MPCARRRRRPQPVSPDYLLAHQEYSPTTQIQGVGPYLRAVVGGRARMAGRSVGVAAGAAR